MMLVTMKLIMLGVTLMVVIAVGPASTQTIVYSVCVIKTLLQKLIFHVSSILFIQCWTVASILAFGCSQMFGL